MNEQDKRGYKAIAGIGTIMFGVGQLAASFVDVAPMVTGSALALLGGIYIVEIVRSTPTEEVAA